MVQYWIQKNKFIPFVLFIVLLFTHCLSEEDFHKQENSNFKGNWFGSFIGDSQGNIWFTIDRTGHIEGTIHIIPDSEHQIEGHIFSGGKFNLSSRNGYIFNGYLELAPNEKSIGKWTKGSQYKGTYLIQKSK